jgi:hypothetical protein
MGYTMGIWVEAMDINIIINIISIFLWIKNKW